MNREYNPHDSGISRYEEAEKSAFERAFSVTFLQEDQLQAHGNYDFRTRVIPKSASYGLPTDLAGQSVAVVGNGVIESCGANIDAHDQIIRISGMRNWRGDAVADGRRTTLWAGHPAFVIDRDGGGEVRVNAAFDMLVRRGIELWAVSPFHISCDSYMWLMRQETLGRFLIAPSPISLRGLLRDHIPSEEIGELFLVATGRRHLTGLTQFELLLTGTRLILLLEAANVEAVSLYGFDLFKNSRDPPWFGHDISFDLKIMKNIQRRFLATNKSFYWHEASLYL